MSSESSMTFAGRVDQAVQTIWQLGILYKTRKGKNNDNMHTGLTVSLLFNTDKTHRPSNNFRWFTGQHRLRDDPCDPSNYDDPFDSWPIDLLTCLVSCTSSACALYFFCVRHLLIHTFSFARNPNYCKSVALPPQCDRRTDEQTLQTYSVYLAQ